MDLQPPGLGGIEATTCLHSMPGRRRIPVIALPASVLEADHLRFLGAGMHDHPAQPVAPPLLHAALLRSLACG